MRKSQHKGFLWRTNDLCIKAPEVGGNLQKELEEWFMDHG
jgi:hypothetical protein